MADPSLSAAPQPLTSLGPLPSAPTPSLAPAPGPAPALDGQACSIGGG